MISSPSRQTVPSVSQDTSWEDLVVDNLPLVELVLDTMNVTAIRPFDREDLIQRGRLGLIKAAKGFDSSRKLLFSTYASHRIRGSILDEIRTQGYRPETGKDTRMPQLSQLGGNAVPNRIYAVAIEDAHEPLAESDDTFCAGLKKIRRFDPVLARALEAIVLDGVCFKDAARMLGVTSKNMYFRLGCLRRYFLTPEELFYPATK